MTTDYRAELQRLVKAYDDHGGKWPEGDVEALFQAVERARAYLDQPEPEEFTDEELLRCYGLAKRDHCYEGPIDDWPKRAERAATVHGLRAVIAADRARWGRPSIEPVSLSESVPGPKDCDEEGRCWYFFMDSVIGGCGWQMFNEEENEQLETSYFWLPHYSLPIPTTTTETP